MSYLLQQGESSIFQELKEAGYHVWMNARNDLVAAQVPGLLEQHTSEIYYGGEAPDAPGPVEEKRGNRGDNDYYSMYHGELGLDENGRNYGSDDEDVDAAIERIKTFAGEKPLCLFVGLLNPHPPYQVEEPYYAAIDRSKVPKRIIPDGGHHKPKMEDVIRKNQGMQDYTEMDWTELRATYLGMCMKVDALFKKLCDALIEAG